MAVAPDITRGLQATYNDLLALQDQADTVPLATALDAVGLALSSLATARKALEPFAEIAKEFTDQLTDDRKNTMHWAVPTVGQFRAALAALEGSRS